MPKLKQKIIFLVSKLYFWFFKEEISPVMKEFLLHLSYITFSSFIVAGLMMIVQIVAGRLMGPSQYGKFALTLSIASILTTVSMLGLHVSAMYYITKERRHAQLISASLIGAFINIVVVTIIWFIFLNFWVKTFKIDSSVAIYASIFTAVNTLYHVNRGYLRGLNKMKQFAIYDIISATIATAIFFVLLFLSPHKTFSLIIISRTAMLFIYCVLVFYQIYPYFRRFAFSDLKHLYSYGFFAFVSSVGTLILSSTDRIILNYYHGAYSAGLYTAYFLASQTIIFQLYFSFQTIFFPAAAKSKDKLNLVRKLNGAVLKISPIIFLLNIPITAFIIFLFGKNYPFNLTLIIMFSINTLFYIIYQTYGWLLNSLGRKGMRDNALYVTLCAALFILLSLYTVPRWDIIGTIVALTISNVTLSVIMIMHTAASIKHQTIKSSIST